MKIGLFTDTYYPELNGVAASVFLLQQELQKRGHEVYVITTTTPGAPEHEVNVFRVPSLPCFFLSERRVGLFYQNKLDHIIKSLKLDIIHTQTEFSIGIFGRIVAKKFHIPAIHTYHTIYEDYTHYIMPLHLLEKGVKAFARKYSRFFCNHGVHVIVPTGKVKELLERYGVKQSISVIPTGIDLQKFRRESYSEELLNRKKQETGVQEAEKVLLYVGRIAQEKNIDELIRLLPLFFQHHPNAKFLIIGGGPAIHELTELSKEKGISDCLIFAGPKPWDDIGQYYALGDVFISASTSETQGLTYIEAMAAGLPVVAKKDECLDEVVSQGKNGYTFETEEEFLTRLEEVLYLKKDIDFSVNAREKAEEYSKERFAERIEEVYENVIFFSGKM